jgi:type I restriction enzyme M protein
MFRGKEKKSLAYVLAVMNMILHGIEAPNVLRTNTLKENMADVQDKDKVDVILANPPFGGQEDPEVKQGFQIKTGETALLFMQYFIRHLKIGGRAGVVIKNTFLSGTGDAYAAIRKDLLETCNLHTIMNCPQGTFQGAGVGTVVLIFEKGKPTKKIWYYDLDPGRKMGKSNPLNDADLEEFLKLQKSKAESPKSWIIDVKDVDAGTCDLSVRNPNAPEEAPLRSPAEIIAEIERLDEESAEILKKLKELIK